MSDSNENKRFVWSISGTNLLLSVWRHDKIQEQLKYASRSHAVWESIAKYMSRKGFPVTGAQCRSRVRNMLNHYQETVKEKDLKKFEPYYNIFEKVLENKKNEKKKEGRLRRSKRNRTSKDIDTESEISSDSNSFDEDHNVSKNSEHQEKVSGVNDHGSSGSCLNSNETLKEVKRLIVQAVDSQMKTVLDVIKAQSQTFEKLIKAEREKLGPILDSESESRKKFETRLDMLLSKFEGIEIPQITIVGTVIDTPVTIESYCPSYT